MRLIQATNDDERRDLKEFTEWIFGIGDGTIGKDTNYGTIIEIPSDILLPPGDDSIANMVNAIYPNFELIMNEPDYIKTRAILAPTLEYVDVINDYMVSLNYRDSKRYLSYDSTCKSDTNVDILVDVHTPEFLNSIKCSGLPSHELILKVGTHVMLLRNIDHSRGLCNGTCLIITRVGKKVLQARVLTGNSSEDYVLIPLLTLTPSDVRIPFRFQKRQFPLLVCYAMTINKSQGKSLKTVGVYLKRPIFNYGQLYVVVSKVTSKNGLKIIVFDLNNEEKNECRNFVFKEVFRNV